MAFRKMPLNTSETDLVTSMAAGIAIAAFVAGHAFKVPGLLGAALPR